MAAKRDIATGRLGPLESCCWPIKGRHSAMAGRRGSACLLKLLFSLRIVNWTMLGVVLELDRRVLSGFTPLRVYQDAVMGV